ncbi:hypothetical protein GCM10027053_51960 [Intrasporangium mesophilum]
MSTPLSTAADLGVYLGVDDIDPARAGLLLQLAHDRLETIVSPLPDTAKSIELAVAGRAYQNVSSAQSMGLGSANISFGSTTGGGGLYLTKAERADLRRLAGRTGAFVIDLLPDDSTC